jgi:glycosyltransferase involved in cell wall biosynthesis
MTSESEKRFFQRLVPSYLSDKIRVIYHGVDHSVFKVLSNRAEIEKDIEMRYGVRVPYIFHVSGYQPVKNVRSILQAFCVLKKTYEHDLKLVLAGNTQGHINKLLETARALGLSKELIFTGYVPNKDLPKLYNCAELFVFPSLRESFGLPLLEAMACGTPIVASNRFSIPEIVGGAGILVDPLNASALAKAAHLVLESDEIRKDLTKKGVDRAKTFTWEKCAREHLKIYEEVTCR